MVRILLNGLLLLMLEPFRRRFLSARAVVVWVAVVSQVVALGERQAAAARPDVSAAAWFEAVEEAVAAASGERLSEIQAELESRLEEERPPDPSMRYGFAYVNWRISQIVESRGASKKLLKEAQAHLDELLEGAPNHAEAHALRGTVIGDRITGALGGMLLGPKAGSSLERAFELEPQNPRVALQRRIGFFYTPRAFGGGQEKAEAEIRRARELFENGGFEGRWPFWGRVDALAWLGLVLTEGGSYQEARAAFEEALTLEPGHAWVRDELLPALEEAAGGG